ncbi:MAG: DsbA family protein [Thermanaerothrix sp.]|nr:DsbA family protein [Thermanaerothrix sp.]
MEVFFDFACPYCYLAWSFLKKLGNPLKGLEWTPWQIMPEVPEGGMNRRWSNLGALRALGEPAEANFADLNLVPNTKRALAAYLWAKARGKGQAAGDALFSAFFARGLNISDPDAIVRVFSEAGLENPAASFDDPLLHKTLEENDRRAEEIGVEVVPSFVSDHRVVLRWDTSFTVEDLAERISSWR